MFSSRESPGLKLQGYLIQERRRLRPSHARNVVNLGLGAMLHDIGLTQLSPDVRQRYEQLRDDSDPDWRQHVELGHKLVTGSIDSSASAVVLHHHQHYDGSGFPPRVDRGGKVRVWSGHDIHVFARIVCVANHFDRLRHAPGATPLPRVRVMKQMLCTPLARRFDPVILSVLPLVVPAYPPGAIVTLSNLKRAVVTSWTPSAPCQPTVQVLAKSSEPAQDPPARVVCYDLRERRNLTIVEIDGIDVSSDNFELDPSRALQLPDSPADAA